MMNSYGSLFKNQSQRSLQRIKTQPIEQRVQQTAKGLLSTQKTPVSHSSLIHNTHSRQSLPKNVQEIINVPKQHSSTSQQLNKFTISYNSTKDNKAGKRENQQSRQVMNTTSDKERIALLQKQLKRKLCEDSLLRNIFRTKKHYQMTHLDIFLQIGRLQDQLNAQKENVQSLKERVNELQNQLESKDKNHIKNLQVMYQEISVKQAEWLECKAELTEDYNIQKDKSETLNLLIEELRHKNATLVTKNQQISSENEKQKTQMLKKNKQQKEDLNSVLKKLNEEINELQQQLSQVRDECSQLQNQNQALRCQAEQERAQHESLKAELNQLKAILDQTQQEIAKIKQQKQHQSNFNAQYIEQLEQNHQKEVRLITDSFKQKNKMHQTQISQFKEKLGQLKNQYTNTCQELANKTQNLNKIDKQMTSLKNQLNQEQEQSGKLIRQKKQHQFMFEQKQTQLNNVFKDLQKKQQTIQRLENQNYELLEQQNHLQQKYSTLQQQINYVQSFSKLNDKVYNENYKCLGRLMGINQQLRTTLHLDNEISQEKEQLGPVVSQLSQLVQALLEEKISSDKRKNSIGSWIREFKHIMQEVDLLIDNKILTQSIEKYQEILSKRENGTQNADFTDAYKNIIQILKQQASHKTQTRCKPSLKPQQSTKQLKFQNAHISNFSSVKDSLQIDYLQQRNGLSKYRFSKKQKETQENEAKKQQNKQNMFEQIQKTQNIKPSRNFSKGQRMGMNANCHRDSSQQRLQIEKKYFRS